MTQALPGTDFNSSGLIRLLAELSIVEAAGSREFPAERLGQWLDVAAAITLHAAHNAGSASSPAAQPVVEFGSGVAVQEEFARLRTARVESITASCSPAGGSTRIRLPMPKLGVDPEAAAAYGPYRRFYLAHQAEMEPGIRALRSRLRQALAGASTRLRLLAALDEALDRILTARERQLLATLPSLLERRFQQLLAAHQRALLDSGQADEPLLWMQQGGWLAIFCEELQAMLIAELDLRLQPTLGLIEALHNEADRH
jgi:hypothetical protein